MDACRCCFASLFTDRAITYRRDKGFDHLQVAPSIGVRVMVRSDLATSGVMFSIDTETGFREAVLQSLPESGRRSQDHAPILEAERKRNDSQHRALRRMTTEPSS